MDAVDEVKSRLAIEDVIGEYVQLKRAGRNWRGLSPFSSEKTPSFMVSPEKQIWHDFSSNKGGNMFSFVMEMEGLDFKAALELLARKAGVELEQYRSTKHGGPSKERLHQVNQAATRFYQLQFSKSQVALEYVLKQRAFSKQTALDWQLGYSPTSGRALLDYLKSKQFTDNEIKRAGLTNSYGKDMFRGRLMVPLADSQGQVVGFTARLLASDDNAPKYINTPQTVLYDKSRQVFGLHHAKDAIRHAKFVVLVEGNLDVIASHGVGVKNVVATAGTAMTEQHLKTLARFTTDIRLAFDADSAGLNATERAIKIAGKLDLTLNVIPIPDGKDPDELIKKQGVKAWQQVIAKPHYALDWLIERYQAKLDLDTAPGKREFTSILLPTIRQLGDSVEQDHFLRKIAQITGVSIDSLSTKMGQASESTKPLKRPKVEVTMPDRLTVDRQRNEDSLLCLLFTHPSLRTEADIITPDMFSRSAAGQMFEFLRQNLDYYSQLNNLEQSGISKDLVEYAKILLLEYEEIYQTEVDIDDMRCGVVSLQSRLVQIYVRIEKAKLREKYNTNEEADQRLLAEESRQYDLLLRKVQGA